MCACFGSVVSNTTEHFIPTVTRTICSVFFLHERSLFNLVKWTNKQRTATNINRFWLFLELPFFVPQPLFVLLVHWIEIWYVFLLEFSPQLIS